MEVFHTRSAIAVALLVAAGAANAQIADPAKLFAKEPEYQGATLSPTGTYVAVTTPYEDRRALSLIKLSGNFERSVIKFDVGEDPLSGDIVIPQPTGQFWSDDERIVVTKSKDFGRFGSFVTTGEIYSSDADGTNQVQLFGYMLDRSNVRARLKDNGRPTAFKVIEGSHGKTLFYYRPWLTANSKNITSVFRVDTHKGTREQIESFPDFVAVDADNAGVLRVNTRWDLQDKQLVQYRPTPTSAWTALPESVAGKSLNVLRFDPDENHAYAAISEHGEPAALYRMDFAAGTRERLAGLPTSDISGLEWAGRNGPPVVVSYAAGKPKVDYLDPKSPWAQLHAGLMKAFPGQMISFVDVTRDENTLLFYAYSDRHPGAYYLFDRRTNKPSLLFQTREWIDPAKMSPMQPLEFKNRGGDTLYAFLTTPLGKQGPHPLIVIPHGGPFGVSDAWGFDNDAQFFASLGYAVLQVNYRGSGMRGDDFMESAYKQWGTGIQDDIADGVKHVIAQKLADPGKVCIYGASFGGYSALMNPIRNPGMYKCAIAYAGVYDLKSLTSEQDGSKQMRSFFSRSMGDAVSQADQSPVNLIAKMDAPVLLIHGKSDMTAPYSQFRQAESALSHSGKTFETLTKADEGHGFYREANRVEAYQRMRAFLQKYNPVN
jgi:dipeptidyl aminopeptidase/acylaminoacyl peptidase